MKIKPYSLKKLYKAYQRASEALIYRSEYVHHFKPKLFLEIERDTDNTSKYQATQDIQRRIFKTLETLVELNINLGFSNIYIQEWSIVSHKEKDKTFFYPMIKFTRKWKLRE